MSRRTHRSASGPWVEARRLVALLLLGMIGPAAGLAAADAQVQTQAQAQAQAEAEAGSGAGAEAGTAPATAEAGGGDDAGRAERPEAMPGAAPAAEAPVAEEGERPPRGSGPPSVIAQFTTAVEDREPIDQVSFVSNDTRQIFFFTDLRNLEGQVVTHRWLYSGKTMAEVDFQVRGPRWRVWSSKTLLPDWIGDWTVEIVTESGEVIAAETFTFSAPEA